MNVKTFLENNKPSKYIITDRVRTPIPEDTLKYLDLSTINVNRSETKNETLYIYTDFIADSC
ncbi:MAG TPA: hypothetical protein GX742_00025 [Acholeplasmataceae bacterium]|nr:hypothetical protein [Acholeplasmataceae bacterium]